MGANVEALTVDRVAQVRVCAKAAEVLDVLSRVTVNVRPSPCEIVLQLRVGDTGVRVDAPLVIERRPLARSAVVLPHESSVIEIETVRLVVVDDLAKLRA